MPSLRENYINFIEKDKHGIIEKIIYFFLFLFSLIYGVIAALRNFFYDSGIFNSCKCPVKIISVGNISWGGSGKTTLAAFLYGKLAPQYCLAVLRRGYGDDEKALLEEKKIPVFSSPKRAKLAKDLADKFNLFILDDGFQYRKLCRDINIVVVSARELKKECRLLPAGIFREPFAALKRADILIVNHKQEIDNAARLFAKLRKNFRDLSIYTCEYKFLKITDMKNREVNLGLIRGKKLAAFCAIGYPQGFFRKLEELGLKICKKITYPDHHNLSKGEFSLLQESLNREGIFDVLITGKDKYHLPQAAQTINFYVFEIEMAIDEEEKFLKEIRGRLKGSGKDKYLIPN